jgi:predicted MFS family arabinose efflux permease
MSHPVREPHGAREPTPAGIGAGLTFAMAAACGLAVANIYYNQPMLGLIDREFPGAGAAGIVPTATQLGYALGLLLLVPLGDLVERRRLIVIQFVLLGLTLVGAALAPDAWTLAGASLLIGVAATVAQQIVPFAATLSAPESRGRTIGRVMSGLLCGILFSRTLSGFVSTHFGWRWMFWIGVPLSLLGALGMALCLPRSRPSSTLGYGALIASLGELWRNEPALRRATATQAALFASFISFWTILPLYLMEHYRLGADIAGLFGIVGAAGVFAAPMAGHLADRRGPRLVIGMGTAIVAASWLLFGAWVAIAGLVIGVILLDFGVQSALVSNQHVIYALRPEARSRLNTVFMSGMFIGGALGSGGVAIAWHMGGWWAVCVFGAVLGLVALALEFAGRRRG